MFSSVPEVNEATLKTAITSSVFLHPSLRELALHLHLKFYFYKNVFKSIS